MSDEVRRAGNAVTGDQPTAPLDLKQRLVAADVFAVAVGIVLAFGWRALMKSETELDVMRTHMMLAILSFPIWPICLTLNKVYLARAVERQTEEIRRIVHASLMSVGFIVGAAFVAQFHTLSRLWVLSLLVFVPLCLVIERTVARRIFARLRREGRIQRRVLVVGTDAEAIGLVHATQRHPELGYQVVGFVGPDDIGTRGGCEVLGGFEDTQTVLEQSGANGVMISLASVEPNLVNRLTRQLTDTGYHVALSSGLRDIDIVRFRAQDIGGHTLVYVEPTMRDGWRVIAKRVFDIALSVFALVLVGPILLVAAIAIKLDSRGPVFFAQERVGRDGRSFRMVKLRTMVADADARKADLADQNEADGPMFKMAERPAHHQGRGDPAQALDRRDPPVRQRAARRDERRRSPSRPRRRGRAVDRGRPRPPAGPARHHRHVAGVGTIGHHVRRVQAARPLLRRQLVARPRSAHRGQDVHRRARQTRRPLTRRGLTRK